MVFGDHCSGLAGTIDLTDNLSLESLGIGPASGFGGWVFGGFGHGRLPRQRVAGEPRYRTSAKRTCGVTGRLHISSSTELLAQYMDDARTDIDSLRDENAWWVCQSEEMWGDKLHAFVLEADKETVLNLQTVAKALGISVATSPGL